MIEIDQILSSEERHELRKTFGVKSFQQTAHLFYEGHIPLFGFILINGECRLFKKKKLVCHLEIGTIIGAKEILNYLPFSYSGIIAENSELIIIDRTSLLEITEQRSPKHLFNILSKNLISSQSA